MNLLQLAVKSFHQILTPAFRGILYRTILLTLALLISTGIGLRSLAGHFVEGYSPWIVTTVTLLTSLVFTFAAAYLIAPVSSIVAGFFLDDVAAKVEAADYPADPPGRALPFADAMWMSLRFALLIGLVNLAALALLLVPGVNAIAFFVANAYLLGREYFELAACRFRGLDGARDFRRANGPHIFVAGLIIAALLAVPVLNLLTPLFGTVFMVHLHKQMSSEIGASLVSRT